MHVLTMDVRRIAALVGMVALTAVALVAGVGSAPASATAISVANETQFRDALSTLSSDNSGPHTITLTSSFSITQDGTPEYLGRESLTINGGGHTVTYAPASSNESGFLLFDPDEVPDFGQIADLTLINITVEGFDDIGAVDVYTDGDLTIESSHYNNNYRPSSAGPGYGGAISAYDVGGTVYITDSTFTGNSAENDSGVIDIGEDAYIDNSTFKNNDSGSDGGAMYVSGDAYITGSTFEGNSADGEGGAIYASSDAYITDSVFTDNEAYDYGGAVYVEYVLEVEGSSFVNNFSDSNGGAIYIYDYDDAEVYDSYFEGNEASDYGGAIYADDYDLYVYGSTFVGNVAFDGGALYGWGAVEVENSTFTDNSAVDDGGAIWSSGRAYVTFSTFVDNYADREGAHVYTGFVLHPAASVFAGASGSDGCYEDGGIDSEGYNFDQDGTCTASGGGTGEFGAGADPMLGALADNGGPTVTMNPLENSPLIDAAPSALCEGGTDQRGIERPLGDGCDVGAVEYISDIQFVITTSDGDTINGTVSNALCVQDVAWEPTSAYPTPPAGLSVPFGVSSFSFCVPFAGWTVDVALDLPRPVNSLWKVTEGGGWVEISSATFDDTVASYSITEGGPLDESSDPTLIQDPVAPGVTAAFTG